MRHNEEKNKFHVQGYVLSTRVNCRVFIRINEYKIEMMR